MGAKTETLREELRSTISNMSEEQLKRLLDFIACMEKATDMEEARK